MRFAVTFLSVAISLSVLGQVTVLPPSKTDHMGDYLRRQAEREAQERQHAHEMEMARQRAEAEQKLVAAQRAQSQQPTNAAVTPEWSFDRTKGQINGRAWLTWPHALRMLYLMGVYDGLESGLTDPFTREAFSTSATYAEIAEGVTALCADPSLRSAPISRLVPIFAAKTRGAQPTEIETLKAVMLASLRE